MGSDNGEIEVATAQMLCWIVKHVGKNL